MIARLLHHILDALPHPSAVADWLSNPLTSAVVQILVGLVGGER